MADTRLSPAPAVAGTLAVPGLAVAPVEVASRLVLWGAAAVAPASAALGLALPTAPCRAATGDGLAALWLGPDEWLVTAEAEPPHALAARLAAALAGVPHALVDVTQRQARLAVSGARATDVLAVAVALDLDASTFPAGACTRTLFGKAEIVLWRTADDAFAIECGRSFAPYVLGVLCEGAREYG